jgi:hypothetical protein
LDRAGASAIQQAHNVVGLSLEPHPVPIFYEFSPLEAAPTQPVSMRKAYSALQIPALFDPAFSNAV